MTTATPESTGFPVLQSLPTDEVRQILWRFKDRLDLQKAVQSARSVARGPVARLVADGERKTHEWTEGKRGMLSAFDAAGITSIVLEPEQGGFIAGPKNLGMALTAFELAWVDSGAATSSLASGLALEPIIERGTADQRQEYLSRCAPAPAGEDRTTARGAFCLTEPPPYVGVDTGVLSGKIKVVDWKGDEPVLHVEKRGRFITNMDFAEFVVAAVESDDPRIKGTCMVILEEGDEGVFDRGAVTHKLAHQLSSTRDPIFNLKVPASRIVGGYGIEDGVIVPNYSHGKILEVVFARTRVPVGIMTASKLLSTVEPVIRYQRERFRGGEGQPGTPRHDLGLQMKEDALQRLVGVWATGEAAASLGFATARHLDAHDELRRKKDDLFLAAGATDGSELLRVRKVAQKRALEYLEQAAKSPSDRDASRFAELEGDELTRYLVDESVANVLTPATKLWNTGHGTTVLREAVSLMGGYGITEDCPGFLPQKWFDAQLDAIYEGPESVQRRQLVATMTSELFLAQFGRWVQEMRWLASDEPGSGACTLGSAMELWLWTLRHMRDAKDADGELLYRDRRQGATFPMADALCWLLAARFQILDVLELKAKGADDATLADGLPGWVQFLTDLCHVQSAHAAGEVGRICAELVFGYQRHPSWDVKCEACYGGDEVDELEGLIPGFAFGTRGRGEVMESDGSHPKKAGPCVRFAGLERFQHLRGKLDGCLAGARLAKDRAGQALTNVMIPAALDYPA